MPVQSTAVGGDYSDPLLKLKYKCNNLKMLRYKKSSFA